MEADKSATKKQRGDGVARERGFPMQQEASFGQWLRLQRKELDLTQDALAERIGCSRDAIQKIEAGARRPSRQITELLATCLGIPAADQAAFIRWARLGVGASPPNLILSTSSSVSPPP